MYHVLFLVSPFLTWFCSSACLLSLNCLFSCCCFFHTFLSLALAHIITCFFFPCHVPALSCDLSCSVSTLGTPGQWQDRSLSMVRHFSFTQFKESNLQVLFGIERDFLEILSLNEVWLQNFLTLNVIKAVKMQSQPYMDIQKSSNYCLKAL